LSTDLFTVALGLQSPWVVDDIRFEPEQGEIHFELQCQSQRLGCPSCGAGGQRIHDRLKRSWQHLHFFQYRAFLHAAVPRVKCEGCGKVSQVPVPWARPGSGFTLLMDALVLTLAQKLPIRQIAGLMGVGEKRIQQAITVHVEAARRQESYADVWQLGVDEKHVGRLGYVTLFHDVVQRRVLFGTEGRDAKTFEAFRDDFAVHGGEAQRIQVVAMDMSKAYQSGAHQVLPEAAICFDGFHVAKLVNEALDRVRREEVKQEAALKGIRWGTLKAPQKWTAKQTTTMDWLQDSGLKTARAWRLKERWREIHQLARQGQPAEPLYQAWIAWARRCRLTPFKKLGQTLREHLPGILNAYQYHVSNAAAESINSQVQAAIIRARGYRNLNNLLNMIYLVVGKLTHLPASPYDLVKPSC
jgi:transposase